MGKRKKTVDLLISLTLVATILVSVFVCSYPAVSAAESEDAVTGQEVGEELVIPPLSIVMLPLTAFPMCLTPICVMICPISI